MRAGRRFPRPNPPLRGGQGLLGHAPPGFGSPHGAPHQPIPPTGVPPPPIHGCNTNVLQPGFPRWPPPGLPPVIPQPNNQQQSQGTGLTSPIPGAVPPRGGLLGHPQNLSQPSPQSHLPGIQQPQQQQQPGKNSFSIPGVEKAFSDLQGSERDAALAIVSQILERGLGGATAAQGNVTTPTPQGLSNPVGAGATFIPNLNVPPPPFNSSTAQLASMQNSQTAQAQQQLQQTSFTTNMNNAMSTMTSMNRKIQQPQQYNSNTDGTGISSVSAVGGLLGSNSTTSPGLTLPGAIQTSHYSASTNQGGLLNTPDLHSPPPQVPPTGSNTTTVKQPLLRLPPGVDPSIPPPNHLHGVSQGGLLPNPATNMYQQDPQQVATEQQHHPLSDNGTNVQRPGVSKASFINNI